MCLALYNTRCYVTVWKKKLNIAYSILLTTLLLKFAALYAHYLETRHFSWAPCTYPLQHVAILIHHGALPNLQTNKTKLE
jgi:hypothetical protein